MSRPCYPTLYTPLKTLKSHLTRGVCRLQVVHIQPPGNGWRLGSPVRLEPGAGLAVMGDVFMVAHRAPIILAAARNNVPAVYTLSAFALGESYVALHGNAT
jgi:hypothetical protein